MTLRARVILIIIISIGAILVLFGIVKLISFVKGGPAPTEQVAPVDQADGPQYDPNPPAPAPVEKPAAPVFRKDEAPAEAKIGSFVLPFVERLGTYSNQGNFENLEDLLPSMTENMKVWAERKIAEAKAKPFQKMYQGTTTRALSYKIEVIDEAAGTASVRVSAQRKESVGSDSNARTTIQDCMLVLKKVGEMWLVDSAKWQ